MEYADDGDVLSKLNQERTANTYIDEETILAWLAQCVNALAHLHSNGIIHRDVKTANMFLTKEGVLKLGDFGGSRHFKVRVTFKLSMVLLMVGVYVGRGQRG